ncbi:MAG TPA: hypothetical protein VFK19_03195 [Sphingomicrobium sp.]|nr:hypothetical protein [Sphingomicrobium sp.]
MKQTFLIAGAAAFAFSVSALAKPGHGHGNPHAYGERGYGARGCPPGLAKKAIPCVPPGQAKKLYNIGQRFPLGYGDRFGFNQIPYELRRQYAFNPNDRYYYGDGYLYRVDPRTMLIEQVVRALLR